MTTKAKLTIVLKADQTVVAESEDAGLWQRVLAAIHSGTGSVLGPKEAEHARLEDLGEDGAVDTSVDKAVARFAKSLGLDIPIVVGALSPSREAPYLQLDHYCWAAMKKGTPKRGPWAMNPTGLAGTLLVLWFKEAKIEVPATQSLAGAVLDTIKVKDPNPSRGIKNTKWLQGRAGGSIVINAAEITKAQEIARSFCTKQWSGTAK